MLFLFVSTLLFLIRNNLKSNHPNLMAEALLTRMSIPPKVLTAASMHAWTCSSLRMSTMKGKASPPAASTTGQGRGRFNFNRLLGQVHFLTRFTFCACSRSYGSIKNSALFKAVSLNDVFKYKYSLNI